MSAQKKAVLITGCSEGGIGDALAREFHQRGLRVFASARNLARIQHLQAAGIEVLRLDVVDKTSVQYAVGEVSKLTGGTLDYLVNNSGVGYLMPLLDVDLDEARRVFEVNVWGTLAMIQAFAPLLAAAADKGSPARIVNIGSVVSRMQVPWQGVYNASKAALHMINDTLRLEVAPFDIEVLHVVTGGIQTKFFENSTGAVLDENSAYEPVREIIEADVAGKAAKRSQTMSAEEYAKAVVSNALSRRPTKTLWVGGRARLSWLGDRFGWSTINDWFISNLMGWSMGGLRKKLRSTKRKLTA
ncbi:putative short-chain dehydrogenase/reductase [Xylariaceae sp. FL1651]|nr:putative short-chain dehydrogenase/reductase [Xylariaceae sp. FL1651]